MGQSHITNPEAAAFQRRLQHGIEEIRRCGFWFVDIPRTSSSSIRVELGQQYGPIYGKQNLFDQQHASVQLFPDHIPAIKMRQLIGNELWASIFTFTFVRNPWDRMVSLYHYLKSSGNIRGQMKFREFVYLLKEAKEGANIPLFRYHGHHYGGVDFVQDEQNNIIVDFIGKFENRENDIREIKEKLGCKSLGDLTIQKACISGKHYSAFYDEETMVIIGKIYAEDVRLFDYCF